jgi:tetratricopeptide (TPR) repeat protein
MTDGTQAGQSIQASNDIIAVGDINVGGSIENQIIGNNNTIYSSEKVLRFLYQLPQPPADFTGREELIAQLVQDFKAHQGVAITGKSLYGLTGMGGIGKTALGLVVAHKISEDYPDGQIFIDLKGTTEPLSILEIMRHVILSFEPETDVKTLDEAGMQAAYLSVLHGKKVLLFLDNARSAEQIASLQPSEICAMLVTSRWVFPIPGLQSRRVDLLSEKDAVKLLFNLCPRIKDVANELARACACLPLALRIAGSFLQVNGNWKVEKYISQLNDHKHRLDTLLHNREDAELNSEPDLLATFELSYSQLPKEAQKHWRVLGVFPGSFDAQAAQVLWGTEENETLRLLALLGRYSLLDFDAAFSRYRLHDLLMDYACLRISKQEEFKTRLKYASYYKDVLSAANDLYKKGGENVLLGLGLFDLEWENIRTGQGWMAARQRRNPNISMLCLEYSNAGIEVLNLRQNPVERLQWLEVAVSAAREIDDHHSEGAALVNLANTYRNLGDASKAVGYYEQALVIARDTGDRQSEGAALSSLGSAYAELEEVGKAIGYFEQALMIAREISDRRREGRILGNLGSAYMILGETSKAIEFHEQQLIIAREIGDRRSEGVALLGLGSAYYKTRDELKAIQYYEKALAIAHEIGDSRSEGVARGNIGLAYADLGEASKAIGYYEQALTIAHEIGDRRDEGNTLGNLGASYAALGETSKAIEYYEQALLIAREIGDRRDEGSYLANLGKYYKDLGESRKAVGYYEQQLMIDKELCDLLGEETTLSDLGHAYTDLGDIRRAIEYYEQQLVITSKSGNRHSEANALFDIGLALYNLGEKDRAIDLVKQALAIYEAVESPHAENARNQLKEWGILPKDEDLENS